MQYTKLILTDYKDLPQLELTTPYSECLEDFIHPCYGPCLYRFSLNSETVGRDFILVILISLVYQPQDLAQIIYLGHAS